MFGLIVVLLNLFLLILIAYAILSWYVVYARASYDSPVLKVQRLLSAVCDPVLNPIRRIIPTARVGGVGLDLSVLVLFLLIDVILIPLFR
ncbi:MAG TPA: YggT family protein [Acidimicrobiales bacterium]|nr:YggT family protein [Acidimicrobiales bacterium]